MNATTDLSSKVGVKAACDALGVPRSTYYRWTTVGSVDGTKTNELRPPLALDDDERKRVFDLLHGDRFIDMAPHEVYATLLDEGCYLCSIRTMYRILEEHGEIKERRRQVRRPNYSKPELLAVKPNQVWSWDITKLKGPQKWSYFHLYVIIDIYSRYVVGWMVAERESNELAKRLIKESCHKQGIQHDQLTIHADRGASMKSKAVAHLMADLGVTKTHSRPYVSNDNPFSEAQFKTMKYRPEFPDRFGSIQDARGFCRPFFRWYNNEHHHTGIALLTPEQVHYDLAEAILQKRARVLEEAFKKYPTRFKNKVPVPPVLPKAAWINKPERCELETGATTPAELERN